MNKMSALLAQDSKFEPWRSEAEQATSRSRRLRTILHLYKWRKTFFFSLKLEGVEFEPAIYAFPGRQF